jgi:hypothetical protein
LRTLSFPKTMQETDMNNDQILNDDELDRVVGGDHSTGPCGHTGTGGGSTWNQFAGTLVSGAAAGIGAVLGIL